MKKKLCLLFTISFLLTTIFIAVFLNKKSDDDCSIWYYKETNLFCLSTFPCQRKAKVAFLDTGLNYNLIPYMQNEIVDGYYCILDNDCYHDENGHGTSIISLACFKSDTFDYQGINSNIIIVPIVVADKSGITSEDYMCKGILYAVSKNVDIINISIGSSKYSDKVNQALQIAKTNNIMLLSN